MTTAAAQRQKLYRLRRNDGLRVCHVLIHEVDTVAMLLAEGLIASDEPSPRELDAALSHWIYGRVTHNATSDGNVL